MTGNLWDGKTASLKKAKYAYQAKHCKSAAQIEREKETKARAAKRQKIQQAMTEAHQEAAKAMKEAHQEAANTLFTMLSVREQTQELPFTNL